MSRNAQYGIGGALVVGIGALSYGLAIAPIHGTDGAASCARAYADARSHTDSVSVDFLSYRDSSGHKQRCGMLHTPTVTLDRR